MKNLFLNITSIIIAGGLSSRMGTFKPLMILGQKTLLEHIISLYQSAKIKDIIVVTGYRASEINKVTENYKVQTVHNKQFNRGMFSSVLTGIRHISEATNYFFIHPVDIPLVRTHSIATLLNIAKTKQADILYPAFDGKRGHPPLIKIKLKEMIMGWKNTGGLRQCLKNHEKSSLDVLLADETILMDADTQKNYDQLSLRFKKKSLTPKECKVLMEQIIKVPRKIINHCQAVAETAVILANRINKTGVVKLDIDLIYSSSLTHDIAHTHINHASVGGALLNDLGFGEMGNIVRKHLDLIIDKAQPITETEIVYIANKLIINSELANLNDSFRKNKQNYCAHTMILNKIMCRIDCAYKVKK